MPIESVDIEQPFLKPKELPHKRTWLNWLSSWFGVTSDTDEDLTQSELTWTAGLESKVIFYPGMLNTQSQIVKYTGNEIIRLTTGEKARANKLGITLFQPQNIWLYPEIPEIDREITFWQYRYQHLLQYCLGLRVAQLTNDEPTYETIFPKVESGSVVHHFGVKSSPNSLGQATDIEWHKKKYDSLMNLEAAPEHIIAFGPSRGGATTFAAFTKYVREYENIKLCILEGPPGSISAQFKRYFPFFPVSFLYNPWIAYYFLGQEHQTKKEHQAIYHAKDFPSNVPLVIISSIMDEVVCQKSSLNLAWHVAAKRIELNEQGTTHIGKVYFIQLDKATHNYYTDKERYPEDRGRYQNWVHRIYKEYKLPYIEQYAHDAHAEYELSTIELTQGPLQALVKQQVLFKNHKQDRVDIRNKALAVLEHQLQSVMNHEAKKRIARISAEMPLFSKKLNHRFTFFSKDPIQARLSELSEGASLSM